VSQINRLATDASQQVREKLNQSPSSVARQQTEITGATSFARWFGSSLGLCIGLSLGSIILALCLALVVLLARGLGLLP
jgi:hypothetical protein